MKVLNTYKPAIIYTIELTQDECAMIAKSIRTAMKQCEHKDDLAVIHGFLAKEYFCIFEELGYPE